MLPWCIAQQFRMNKRNLLQQAFGFRRSRVSGSHHIHVHPDVGELVNLQNVAGQAKPYQVRQFLRIIECYNLTLED